MIVMLFYRIILFTGLLTSTLSADDQDTLVFSKEIRKEETDYILCRNCGNDISSSEYIISKLSPVSHHSFNDTLFNKDKVLIQVLSHDIFFYYPVITTTYLNCISTGEWEDAPWFPDYRWKLCTCTECGASIGWIFESTSLSVEKHKYFFGFILQTLVGKSSTDSLSAEDQEFLSKCEEELKHRYTEKDEEFMKVFNAEVSVPPIMESWYVPQGGGRWNDRRNRRNHPHDRRGNRDPYERRDRRRDHNRGYDEGHGYRSQRPNYY